MERVLGSIISISLTTISFDDEDFTINKIRLTARKRQVSLVLK